MRTDDWLVGLLDQIFVLGGDLERLRGFLLLHPDHVVASLEAATELLTRFPEGVFSLELNRDEEVQQDELTLTVHTGLPVDEAYALLQEFDEAWWLERSRQLGSSMNVTLLLQ